MTDTEPELYVPRPGAAAWKALTWLIGNPEATLLRKDIIDLTGIAYSSVDMVMQLPTAKGALVKTRNGEGQLGWKLGIVKLFRLDPLPTEQFIPGEQPEAVERKPDGVAKWTAKAPARAAFPPPAPPAPRAPSPAPAIVVAKPPAPAEPPLPLVNVIGRVVGICEGHGTVWVATENGVFRYNEKTADLMHVPFAAQAR